MSDFRMPALGADMESGTLIEWLVKPGEHVHRGQIVAVVDTAKSAIEIEIFEDGTIEDIVVTPGSEVPVGTVLAHVRGEARISPTANAQPVSASPASAPSVAAPEPKHGLAKASPAVRAFAKHQGVDIAAVTGTGPNGRVTHADVEHVAAHLPAEPKAPKTAGAPVANDPPRRPRSSPRARRLAEAAGVDLAAVAGTGPGGAIVEADIAAPSTYSVVVAAGRPETNGNADTPRSAAAGRQASMRRAIGALMERSKREIPHYYLAATIDLGAAMTWLHEHNVDLPPARRLVPAALLFKATARAARATPEMNGHYIDSQFRPASNVRLGVPVALRGGGLLTPAIDDADLLDPAELMDRLRDLVSRAKAGRLRGSELANPTLTVTNLGDQGVDAVYGVIYPPQVALVGFGGVSERPWAIGGLLGVRPLVTATLSADHRVSDGHRGALYLKAIDEALQRPEEL